MNLSKSKYVNGMQCKKMLWLDKNRPEEKVEQNNESVMKNGNLIHEIAKYLFGEHINIEFNENLSEMVNNTNLTLESYRDVVITEASFNYNNNFCSVDILIKKGNKYEMYEVKGSTDLKEVYLEDASYQYYVLTSLGLNVTKVSIIYLNREYVRQGDLDLDKLFVVNDVTDEIIKLSHAVATNIEEMNRTLNSETEPTDDLGVHCFKPYSCPFFKYCSRHLPQPNVFDVSKLGLKEKEKLYQRGIYRYEDLIKEDLNPNHKKQIEFRLYDKEDYIDRERIKDFLNSLKGPIYFLDFETFQTPIPLYDGLKPYEQIPCQYSLHILNGDELEHKEFLAEAGLDPRRSLAERLIKDIPLNVCTLAYNMSFEKGVIKRLADVYPDLKEHLMNIHDNIKDLAIPFQKKWYYSKEMDGLHTIKKVLPALFPDDPALDYHNLDLIHNGSEAMNAFSELASKTLEEQKYIRERLLRYCELDTYAMVKIYHKLKNCIDKSNFKD